DMYPWKTSEMLDLLSSLRARNLAKPDRRPVRLVGFDLQSPGRSTAESLGEALTRNARQHETLVTLRKAGRWLEARRDRDRAMAENLVHLLERGGPESKWILWAHNGHLATTPTFMGHELRTRFGARYVAIGFFAFEGSYLAGSAQENGTIDWTPRVHAL